jgi:bifunctional DNA-binding transcriptional regulator/antitoxin component of YhaV-PrlF toxin-antitoxin module
MATTKSKEFVIKIGSKGEIFPPKELRQSLGLESNQPIIIYQDKNTLSIRKLTSLDEILQHEPKITISYHAWKQLDQEINEDLEK